jgi:hypothetical protein
MHAWSHTQITQTVDFNYADQNTLSCRMVHSELVQVGRGGVGIGVVWERGGGNCGVLVHY